MKRVLLMCAVVIVAVACIKIGTGNATPRLAPLLAAAWAPGDSVRISGHWSAVTDARGNAVQYEWSLRRDGAVAASGTTAERAVQRTFAAPLAGDSAAYQLVVVAVDTRGYRSTEGSSAVLVVRGPWTAPPAPEVGVDTVPGELAAEFDSLDIYFMTYDTHQRIDTENLILEVGDSVQACVEGWKDGAIVGLAGQDPLCGGPPPYFGEEAVGEPLLQKLAQVNHTLWRQAALLADHEGRPMHSQQSREMCEVLTGYSMNSDQCKYGRQESALYAPPAQLAVDERTYYLGMR